MPVDLWSAGVVLYILLVGSPPFERPPAFDPAWLPAFPDEWGWDAVSDQAKDLIRQLLRMNPATRLTAAAALGHPWLAIADPAAAAAGPAAVGTVGAVDWASAVPGDATSAATGAAKGGAEGGGQAMADDEDYASPPAMPPPPPPDLPPATAIPPARRPSPVDTVMAADAARASLRAESVASAAGASAAGASAAGASAGNSYGSSGGSGRSASPRGFALSPRYATSIKHFNAKRKISNVRHAAGPRRRRRVR